MTSEARPQEVDERRVRRLIADQFPAWSNLALHPVASAGTDHAIFRLGEGLAARLPRRESAAPQAICEQIWLPRLAPHLPLPIPAPLAAGAPACGYPWAWTILPWLEGETLTECGLTDLETAAGDLAAFLTALRAIDARGGPLPGARNHGRGLPLERLDRRVRDDISRLAGEIDAAAALEVWRAALAAPAWRAAGVWIHGDLHPGNLLIRGGRLAAALDFGLMAIGDPACDLMIAWSLFDRPARSIFRAAVGADDAMWARGRGWALYASVIDLAFYGASHPELYANRRRTLDRVLAE